MSLFGSDSRDKVVEGLRELSQTDNKKFQEEFKRECETFFVDTYAERGSKLEKHRDAMYGFLYNGADPLQEYATSGHSVFGEYVNAVTNRIAVPKYAADSINCRLDALSQMVFSDKFDVTKLSTEEIAKFLTAMWAIDKNAPRIVNRETGKAEYQGQAVDIAKGIVWKASQQGRVVPLYDSNSSSQERNEWVKRVQDETVTLHSSNVKPRKVTDKVVTGLLFKTDRVKVVDKSVKSPIGVGLTRKGGNEP
ncbi:MAG: hypothetical protein ILP11_04815 [Alphaproteobacteria bacterium]|nr:hypothetical protein [Alphaproteobacteria bacterium]